VVLALLLTFLCARPPVVAQAAPAPAKPVWPARGTITSVFGNDNGRRHPGIDIGLLQSLTVRAAAPGRVILVGRPRGYEGYGNVVGVRTTPRQTEIYAHLAAYGVKRGQRVRVGQRLGTAGCTGWCTGTHLHFEVRRDGRPVNPIRTVLRQARMPAT
jgi:murein DD-endopeptidase MepM/ murein hydrolase activator NlpD